MSKSPSLPSLKANRMTLSCNKLAETSLIIVSSRNSLQRFEILRSLPIGVQLGSMLLGPFAHQPMRPSGKFPSQNFAGFNHNERLVPLVLHVKMCRAVVGMVRM